MPKIKKIHDNIVVIKGQYKYKQDMLFDLSSQATGYLLSANDDTASLLVIGDPSTIDKNNQALKISKKSIGEVKAYSSYFGSIISPFGKIILASHTHKQNKLLGKNMLEQPPTNLLDRVKLSQPLKTGILAIDTMIPIGRGQRELIIGDRSTGKTSIALNTIINQKNTNIKVIYVSIGQKRNSVFQIYDALRQNHANKNTIIIFASPDSASEQFFAPKIGMAMAEIFAHKGEDVLIVLDDLTKHANIYREISLSTEKNPGREAFPTDIFYQHARLLERAGRFNEKYKNGSITCLPIVETVKGDVGSVIPSNIISITDGQIFTSVDMVNASRYPAIDIGLSVSRTGSFVQPKSIRAASKGLKSRYLSLFEINKFADMSVDLSKDLQLKVKDWNGVNNLLLQYGSQGYTIEQMLIAIELFRMKALNELKDPLKFSIAFNNYCQSDIGAKKVIAKMKANEYQTYESWKHALEIIFVPLAKAAAHEHNTIISQEMYEHLKEANYDR